MTRKNNQATCVINVRNGENYIHDAIVSALAQSLKMKILVIDNQSKDDTVRIAKGFKEVKVASTPNPMSLGAARDYSVSFVDTEYVAWLDCDDLWDPEFCRYCVEAFDTDEKISFVGVACKLIDENKVELPYSMQPMAARSGPLIQGGDNLADISRNLHAKTSWHAYMFKTEDIRSTGGFNVDLVYATDLALICNLLKIGTGAFVNKNLAFARIHADQETNRIPPQTQAKEIFDIVEGALTQKDHQQLLSYSRSLKNYFFWRISQKAGQGKLVLVKGLFTHCNIPVIRFILGNKLSFLKRKLLQYIFYSKARTME